jgi:hypothetical protein
MLTDLQAECVYFVDLLFRVQPDQWITEKYSAIHQKYAMQLPPRIQWAMQNKMDLNSIEYFLRIKNPKNALSQKMATIIYLCEMHPNYNSFFEAQTPFSPFQLFLQFFKGGIASGIRLLKGVILYSALCCRKNLT